MLGLNGVSHGELYTATHTHGSTSTHLRSGRVIEGPGAKFGGMPKLRRCVNDASETGFDTCHYQQTISNQINWLSKISSREAAADIVNRVWTTFPHQ